MKLVTVAEAAEQLGVKDADARRALRPLVKMGMIRERSGFTKNGKACRKLDEKAVALLAKALGVWA